MHNKLFNLLPIFHIQKHIIDHSNLFRKLFHLKILQPNITFHYFMILITTGVIYCLFIIIIKLFIIIWFCVLLLLYINTHNLCIIFIKYKNDLIFELFCSSRINIHLIQTLLKFNIY